MFRFEFNLFLLVYLYWDGKEEEHGIIKALLKRKGFCLNLCSFAFLLVFISGWKGGVAWTNQGFIQPREVLSQPKPIFSVAIKIRRCGYCKEIFWDSFLNSKCLLFRLGTVPQRLIQP